jgi:hypothetical protein
MKTDPETDNAATPAAEHAAPKRSKVPDHVREHVEGSVAPKLQELDAIVEQLKGDKLEAGDARQLRERRDELKRLIAAEKKAHGLH